MTTSTGLKTLDHLIEIPLINSMFEKGIGRYNDLKERSTIFSISSSLAEFSFKTLKFAATPVIKLIKDPSILIFFKSLKIKIIIIIFLSYIR